MMGVHQPQKELFSYQVDLDKRVRADHPLRAIAAQIDFNFIREEVAGRYGGNANASKDSVVESSPELIAALKQAYQAQESKLEVTSTPADYEAVNDRMMSITDPDAPVVRKGPDSARAQANSAAAKRDRHRRQVLVEGSFADAANNHGFKRSRWRRLWRQQIQDWMIAAIQNVRILMKRTVGKSKAVQMAVIGLGGGLKRAALSRFCGWNAPYHPLGFYRSLVDFPI
jgi:hypothetical protein